MKLSIHILILLFLLTGCDDKNVIKEPEIKPLYPTTIEKVEAGDLARLRYEYHQNNYFICTSLNKFGFSDCCDDFGPVSEESPPAVLRNIPEIQATEWVEKFLLLNYKHTGVSSTNNLMYSSKNCEIINSNIFWNFVVSNQKIDSVEVLNSRIVVELENGKVTWCTGNWYPEVYIPQTFNYSSEESKLLLLDTIIFSEDVQHNVPLNEENLSESVVRLVIFPVETDEKIELKVAWEIFLPFPFYYLFYLDVMTGEIIWKEPTII